MLNSSNTGDVVADLFGGSGSTLIACERRNRKSRLMELDPKYADCIVCRWQDYTGKQATLEGDGRTFAQLKAEGHAAREAAPEAMSNDDHIQSRRLRRTLPQGVVALLARNGA